MAKPCVRSSDLKGQKVPKFHHGFEHSSSVERAVKLRMVGLHRLQTRFAYTGYRLGSPTQATELVRLHRLQTRFAYTGYRVGSPTQATDSVRLHRLQTRFAYTGYRLGSPAQATDSDLSSSLL
ncbi:hypothetical protein RRG08_027140 [Elysia crispata]|uniref:Uncharacterized protein n=1 Tax=Elysia crispata TaxID=231223 RepID=A0AAE0YV58_9GAST|nr:hypothetical protein RRG08_027140 [Elysia crispata]